MGVLLTGRRNQLTLRSTLPPGGTFPGRRRHAIPTRYAVPTVRACQGCVPTVRGPSGLRADGLRGAAGPRRLREDRLDRVGAGGGVRGQVDEHQAGHREGGRGGEDLPRGAGQGGGGGHGSAPEGRNGGDPRRLGPEMSEFCCGMAYFTQIHGRGPRVAGMSAATVLEVPGPDGATRKVRVSSPDRVMWPEVGVTKLELAEYVVAIGDGLLRAVGDRPVTLQRYPDGIEGEAFYSKNPPRGVPEWTRTVMCTYPSGRRHPQLVVDEVATAVWAVQMNTVTFHPWPVRAADNDNPDELRIDLDPQPGRDFRDAVEAALALRELLRELGLTPWVKTSGNRGVHVHARVRATHEFLDVRHGVIGVARELERRLPDLVTTAWWKEERGERVFVDFNQACRDRTIASAYSPRP